MSDRSHFEHVAVVGVGLMGGSLGLALRHAWPELPITGFDQPSVLDVALERGAITAASDTLEACIGAADLVVFATPVAATLRLLEEAAPYVRDDAVVTDLCSVKAPVVARGREVFGSGVLFVGGHPMTGSERTGIRNAGELLYENASYVLCPPHPAESDGARTPPAPDSDAAGSPEATYESSDDRYTALRSLLTGIGARIIEMDAARHDAAVARVSHLPQLLAVLLVDQAGDESRNIDGLLDLAAGGFRDMTRIAGSPFSVWRDILAGNSGEILDATAAFTRRLQTVRNRLAEDDWDAIGGLFARAERTRQDIPSALTGAIRSIVDVFVFIPDEPGALHRIIANVADAGLDIRDVELLKLREGTGGTFRIGFDSIQSADEAVDVLHAEGIQAYRLD
jgi:prephenate dehydrogenase